ncbi:hypothetical protein N7465_001272, partial [Penicillium sp. CMV-2018d]
PEFSSPKLKISKFPKPTIELQYQGVGPSGSQLDAQRRAQAEEVGRFSMLKTKHYILASAGLGTPLPSPIIHRVYYGIHTTATGQTSANLEVAAASGVPKDSSRYGQKCKRTVYISPRPLLGHRPHRYFFTLIALTESTMVAR